MTEAATALANEIKLVQQSATDAAAFAALYDHYFPRVYNYMRYRVQDGPTADDLTAQVFERTLAHIDRYRPGQAPFAAWLFAIARNTVADHFRTRQRRRWLSLDALREWASSDPQPGQVVAAAEVQSCLLAAVSRLKERERDLIALKFAGGLTNRRIADLTGLSESNVGVILYRAVRRLRRDLEAQGVTAPGVIE